MTWRGHAALLTQSLDNPAGLPTCPHRSNDYDYDPEPPGLLHHLTGLNLPAQEALYHPLLWARSGQRWPRWRVVLATGSIPRRSIRGSANCFRSLARHTSPASADTPFVTTVFAAFSERWLDDSRPERARLRELGVERLILVTRPDPRRIENAARVLNVTVG